MVDDIQRRRPVAEGGGVCLHIIVACLGGGVVDGDGHLPFQRGRHALVHRALLGGRTGRKQAQRGGKADGAGGRN